MDSNKFIESGKFPMRTVDKIMYLLGPIISIFGSAAFLYSFLSTESDKLFYYNSIVPRFIVITFLLLFCLGIFLIFKFLGLNKLVKIKSEIKLNQKIEVISKIESVLNLRIKASKFENCYQYIYLKNFLSSRYTITILIDEYGFYINILNTFDYSILDSGATKHLKRKIIAEIENELRLKSIN